LDRNKSDLVAPANTPEEQPTGKGERNEHTQSSDTGFDRGNAVRAGCIRLRPAADALDSPFYIVGESQDSGLGDLPQSYTAAEFQKKTAQSIDPMPEALDSPYYVLGESRDSGLGDLPVSYAAAEFNATALRANRRTAAWATCRLPTLPRNSRSRLS